MKESEVSLQVRLDLGSRPDTRLFRNNVGTFLNIQGSLATAINVLQRAGLKVTVTKVGLWDGSLDLVGWHTRVVTPEMVGSKVAVFTMIETKRPGHRTDPKRLEKQMNSVQIVQRFGGYAGFAESVDDARRIIGV